MIKKTTSLDEQKFYFNHLNIVIKYLLDIYCLDYI